MVASTRGYGWGARGVQLARRVPDDRFDGTGLPNPLYTEPYGQLDLNVSYQWSDNLTLQAEVINLTDEIQRCTAARKPRWCS